MALPYSEAADDEFDYETEWQESAENTQEGGASLSTGEQSATLTGYIPWNKQRSAARFFLGFAQADTTSPWKMRRENPHAHPQFPWLRCATFTASGVGLVANDENANSEPYVTSPFDETARSTQYELAKVSVGYRNWQCKFLEDDDIAAGEEWRRNVVRRVTPTVEVLSADGVSQLKFAEGGGTGPTAGTTPFPAPIGIQLNKKLYAFQWLNVPWEFLTNEEDTFEPTKIDACVGRVNTDTLFDGFFLAGHVLMLPYTYEEHTFPVASADGVNLLRSVDITLNFSFFDPPRGVAGSYRGHRLFPWRGDSKFYHATRDGTAGGPEMIEGAAFADLFKHVNG